MRNRAKCNLCGDILESLHSTDYVKCSCDAIAIDGGPDNYLCFAKDWDNFLRVDDLGHEIKVKVKDEMDRIDGSNAQDNSSDTFSPDMVHTSDTAKNDGMDDKPRPSREDCLKELQIMIDNIENLPPHAMNSFVSHYDLYSFMLVVSALFKSS